MRCLQSISLKKWQYDSCRLSSVNMCEHEFIENYHSTKVIGLIIDAIIWVKDNLLSRFKY